MSNLRVIEKIGNKPGRTVVILAGVHGNEACGVKAFDSIISDIKIECGKVYFIYANLAAIRKCKRFLEFNLNRCFLENPGYELRNSLEGRTAQEIIPYLIKAEAMLDIHASYTKESVPFVICDKTWIKEAEIFDAEIASYNWDAFHPGSTDYYMNLQKKPGFCYECGYLGDPKAKSRAEKAIFQFLIWAGSISGDLMRYDQKVIMVKSIYQNMRQPFKKARNFPDFFMADGKTLVGKEGNKEIYCGKEDILLFVRDCKSLEMECFLTARKEKQKINKTLVSSKTKETKC